MTTGLVTAVATERAKMRHLRVGLLVALLLLAVVGITLAAGLTSPDFDRSSDLSWNTLLNTFGGAAALATPLLVAIMASRQVDIEHRSGGWLMSATSGVTPGGLCRAKLLLLGGLVALATIGAGAVVAGVGMLAGITAPFPVARWAGLTGALLVVGLVLTAVHVLLAARVENQLVGLGVGLVGTVVALVAPALGTVVAHLTPWGYYTMASAAGYVDSVLVARTPAYASITALGVVTAAVFLVLTRRFDRQEV